MAAGSGAAAGSTFGPIGTVAGGVIGALGSVAGGLIGSSSQKKLTRANIDLQRDFARHGISWRVQDAKEAGLHPLAALGSFPSSASPVVLEDPMGKSIADAGQDISGAAQRVQTTDQRLSTRLQQELLASEIRNKDAETQAIISRTNRGAMENSGPPMPGVYNENTGLPIGQDPAVPGTGLPVGQVELKAPPQMIAKSNLPEFQAGTVKGLSSMMLHPRLEMLTFASEGQESHREIWNETPTWEKMLMLKRNMSYFGKGWLGDWFRVQAGYEPEGTYHVGHGHPDGMTSTLVQPKTGVEEAIERAMKGVKSLRRYGPGSEWSKKHPSGRR